MDLYGRALVDIAIDLINGYLFCSQAATKVDMQVAVATENASTDSATITMKERKAAIARRYITKNAPKIRSLTDLICSGDTSTFTEYSALIGPVISET